MKYLSHYTQEKQTKLFDELGAFFAFSEKQFNEQKKEGVKYVSIGSIGAICPRENAQKLVEGIIKINEDGIAEDIKENGIEAIILRELYNHEAFYTYDLQDTFDSLNGYGVTMDQVREVFNSKKNVSQYD